MAAKSGVEGRGRDAWRGGGGATGVGEVVEKVEHALEYPPLSGFGFMVSVKGCRVSGFKFITYGVEGQG